MIWYRRKRLYVLLLAVLLLVLYADRSWMGRWMYPLGFEDSIVEYSAMYHVDPYLIASIIRVESNFRPDKLSAKGAIGLMQLMPPTAQWIMEQEGNRQSDIDRLHEPEINIKYGAWYVRSLQQQFVAPHTSSEDAVARIAAAYNAGPGNVARWLQDSLWDGSLSGADGVPFGETKHYIHRVYYYYQKYSQIYPNWPVGK